MTQTDLAEEAGVSAELVSRIERGRCLPSLGRMVAFCEALRCTPNDLLGFDGGMSSEERDLLMAWHRLPQARRKEIRRIAEALAKYERFER